MKQGYRFSWEIRLSMKILLSAYACSPTRGSEPGIGWWWALELTRRGHEVCVLTQTHFRKSIEEHHSARTGSTRLRFVYYGLPGRGDKSRRWRVPNRLYFVLWQWGAARFAKMLHRSEHFDLVHHITFGSIRIPSFMGRLGTPFILGPVGGGESAPFNLRVGFGWRGWTTDLVRDLSNSWVRMDPLMRQAFARAKRILVTSEQTRALVPRRFQSKSHLQLAIGCDEQNILKAPQTKRRGRAGFRVLYVGRHLYWKGMHIGIRAFDEHLRSHSSSRLQIVGDGPQERQWRKYVSRLGLAESVEWTPWLSKNELVSVFDQHDVFLFPSLHDSGGMVVLEALCRGLPVVCLDLGGPGQIVDDTCGRVI